mmetsp:Transcript_10463/g.11975  ORF Transcript_10463/g.11975 Transcript_10463/m.11975 type:complete len:275 (+) Transcript_10463:171-995(+)
MKSLKNELKQTKLMIKNNKNNNNNDKCTFVPVERNQEEEEKYMRMALKVGREALEVGEVPVGCVILLHTDDGKSVVVSHGANQVNYTRDATRHAEMVAMDRMLTGGQFSDKQKLPLEVVLKASHGKKNVPQISLERSKELYEDKWTNDPENPKSWKNDYGWGSGKLYPPDIFKKCDLYVTCEPCIMCAAALAKIGIGRLFFGCRNNRFGGCGSLMHLHEADFFPSDPSHLGYPIYTGILEEEAVSLLRSFYNRENFHAPDSKRRKKEDKNENDK